MLIMLGLSHPFEEPVQVPVQLMLMMFVLSGPRTQTAQESVQLMLMMLGSAGPAGHHGRPDLPPGTESQNISRLQSPRLKQ